MRLLSLSLACAFGGCFMMETAAPFYASTSDWLETGPILNKPREEVFKTTWHTIERHGFAPAAYDPAERWIETRWQVQLSPHYREGFRQRLEVELLAAERDAVNIRVRARREINDNARNPMMEEQARWITAGLDDRHKKVLAEPALRLRQSLKLKFFGVSND